MEKRMKCFQTRLKNLRVKRGLTQKALGELLGYSEKTVSKWECGAALPDVEALFCISEIMKVDIESLFSDGERYFLGIDGGGTKTDLVLVDSEGRVLRTHKTEGCNPIDIGLERACEILRTAIFEICAGIDRASVWCFAGIAGGSTGGMKERLSEFFSEMNFARAVNDSDNKNIIAAGLGKIDGMTVILGTGFCVFTQISGVHNRLAGWGYIIDEGGSGYNLGKDALSAYFKAVDGSGEKTLLTEEIDKLYSGDELITYIYSAPKRVAASFAPAVYSAMRRGDDTALKIFSKNMRFAAEMIECASKRFPEGRIPVILAGGLTCEAETLSAIKNALNKNDRFDIKTLDTSPVMGAVKLAMELFENE